VHKLDVFLEVCRDGVRRRAHVLRPRTRIMVRGEGRGEEPARLSDGRVETQPIAVARQRPAASQFVTAFVASGDDAICALTLTYMRISGWATGAETAHVPRPR
jgi:hypothetical protein